MIFMGELKSVKSTSYILVLVSMSVSVVVGSSGFLVCLIFTCKRKEKIRCIFHGTRLYTNKIGP